MIMSKFFYFTITLSQVMLYWSMQGMGTQEGSGQWADYYISPQSFILTFSYS